MKLFDNRKWSSSLTEGLYVYDMITANQIMQGSRDLDQGVLLFRPMVNPGGMEQRL